MYLGGAVVCAWQLPGVPQGVSHGQAPLCRHNALWPWSLNAVLEGFHALRASMEQQERATLGRCVQVLTGQELGEEELESMMRAGRGEGGPAAGSGAARHRERPGPAGCHA